MKIIQVIPVFGMGGAEIMCENLVYELRSLGHEVVVISLYNQRTHIAERLENAGVDIRYLDKKGGIDFSMFGKLKKIFKEEKPDVIHTHLYVTKYVFPIAKKLKIRVIHTIHNMANKEASKLSRRYNKLFYKNKTAIPVALSEEIQNTIVNEYGFEKSFIPVILNGINLNKCQVKKDYSVNDEFKILHVGRFQYQKNHKGLIEAFSIFNKKYPNTKLYLIGDGDLRHETENLVEELGLKSAVKFLGLQSDVHKYISTMDIFTLPSNYEGVPMTLIEAMGSAMPIVATMVGGIPDMLNESSAILVPVDSLAIANAFEKYYLNDSLRKEHGAEALSRSRLFSSNTMAKKYLELYL